ncbi:MAG: hypothetical protein F6K62_12580 [Sphaerospermopsis sp. SIO1G2]|nr:hypothetical protein [Sphaerospermopsis sp. SIO1G2]
MLALFAGINNKAVVINVADINFDIVNPEIFINCNCFYTLKIQDLATYIVIKTATNYLGFAEKFICGD